MSEAIERRRSIQEVWEMWKPRARMAIYPFDFTTYEDNERVLSSLTSLDRDAWADAYMAAALPYQKKAEEAENEGRIVEATDNYLHAYGLYRMARFPTTNSPRKEAAYRESQEMFLKAARFFECPLERVDIPFHGRPQEGSQITAYLQRPEGEAPMPLIMIWGGIDGFKEDKKTQSDLFLAAGFATMTVDIPGTGDAPIVGSVDADRMWDPIFDWVAADPELDEDRVVLWGGGTGGYWATKLAHTRRGRVAAAIDQGGPAHYAFQRDWIEKAEDGEYPFELTETLAHAFGLSSFEDWAKYAPALSLLDGGVLDRPCASLLVVNGLNDTVFPIEDSFLLLEHGDPKSARFYPGPHMGLTPRTLGMIVEWVRQTLRV